MESEGKLESDVKKSSMTLRLKVDREFAQRNERTIVEKLFVGNKTTTTPAIVKAHYRKQGLNPADEIRKQLSARVDTVLAPARLRECLGSVFALTIAGGAMSFSDLSAGGGSTVGTPVLAGLVPTLIAVAWASAAGSAASHWGLARAWASLTPGLIAIVAAVIFLWFSPDQASWGCPPCGPRPRDARPCGVVVVDCGHALAVTRGDCHQDVCGSPRVLRQGVAKPAPGCATSGCRGVSLSTGRQVDHWSARAVSRVGSCVVRAKRPPGLVGKRSPLTPTCGWSLQRGPFGSAGATGTWPRRPAISASTVSPESSSRSGGGGGGGSSSSGGSEAAVVAAGRGSRAIVPGSRPIGVEL